MLILDGARFTAWRAAHTGPAWVVAEHFTVLLGATFLVLGWIALGRVVRTRLEGRSAADAFDLGGALVVDVMVGASLAAVATLLLGAVGLLSDTSVLLLTLVGLAALQRTMRECVGAIWRAIRSGHPAAQWAGALLLVLSIIPALTPPGEWDTLAYHLRIPLGLLEQGSFSVPADSRGYATLIGVAHLATLPLLAAGFMEGPAVVHVLLFPLLVAGTISLARTMRAEASGLLVAAIVIGCPALILVAWTGRIDLVLALAVLAAHRAVVHALDAKSDGAVAVAALTIGAALGVKSIGAAYIVALLPLAVVGRPVPTALLGRAVLLALVACLPWFIKSWWIAGTPLYPLWYWGNLEPWLAQLATAPDLVTLDTRALSTLSQAREPFNLWHAFFAPERITIEQEGRWYGLSPLLLLFPAIVLVARRELRWMLHALVPLVFIALVVLPATAINLRYLMPAYPALAAVTAVVVAQLASVVPRLQRLLVVAAVAIAIVPAWQLAESRGPRFQRQVAHAMGSNDANAFVRRNSLMRSLDDAGSAMARQGSVTDTVLFLWEAQALMIPQPAIIDAFHANWSLLSQLAVAGSCLNGTGIRWIVVGFGSLTYFQSKGVPDHMLRVAQFDRFRERCLGAPVHARDGFLAYPVLQGGAT